MTPRARRWLWGLAVLTAAIVIPIGYLGISGLVHEWRLAQSGRTTCAHVSARQVVRGRSPDYQVKYRFLVGGTSYQAQDETGRRDLWESIPETEWNRSLEAGCVDVLYLPEAPEVNRPSASELSNPPVGNKVAALVLCAMTLGLFAGGVTGIVRVARTRVGRVVAVTEDGWEIVSDDGQRSIRPDDVRRARLTVLPRAAVHPPWRFETDVLTLWMKDGGTVVVAVDPASGQMIDELRSRGALGKRRG